MLVSVPRAQSGGTKWYQLARSSSVLVGALIYWWQIARALFSFSPFNMFKIEIRFAYAIKGKKNIYFDSIKNNPTTIFSRKKKVDKWPVRQAFPTSHCCCCCCYCRLWAGRSSLCVYYSSTHFISCVKYAENRRWRRPLTIRPLGYSLLVISPLLGSVYKRFCAVLGKWRSFLNPRAYDQVLGKNMRNNPSMTLAYHLSSRQQRGQMDSFKSTAVMNYWAG